MRAEFADEAQVDTYSGGFVSLVIIIANVAALIAIGAVALKITRRRADTGATSVTAPTPSTAPVTAHIEISKPNAASRGPASAFVAGASPAPQASPNTEDLSTSKGVASAAEATPAAEAMPTASPTPLATTSAGPATAPNNEPPTPEAEGTESSTGAPNPEVPASQR